ncbi:AAA family ATPase [Sphingobium sp. BHU LFT2]|uniref:AAA family ATPase n=1 Tax=Sphingobium sp. BHU LFT2 TaxID=2807634 RepID=UPI001BE83135|nr:AAA family ATPase [Sphingobium sp. BHU LFT2]MBT2246749.1 AAA family ATPase [Sphingobium sp. BHU LFT2]
MPEAGRAIIRDQVAIGRTALPWADCTDLAELMLGRELRSWHEAHGLKGSVFFNRGITDAAGYLHLCGLPIPAHVGRAAKLFRSPVFIAPPWREILTQETARKQDFAEEEAAHPAMVQIYTDLGYGLIPIPMPQVSERVRFVRAHLKA